MEPDWPAVFSAYPVLAILVDAESLEVLAVSDATLAQTHNRREDLVGRHLLAAFPPREGPSGVDGRSSEQMLLESFDRVRTSGAADRLPVTRYDVLRDGVQEERHWSALHYPVYSAGVLRYFVIQAEDVTEIMRLGGLARSLEAVASSLTASVDVLLRVRSNALGAQSAAHPDQA